MKSQVRTTTNARAATALGLTEQAGRAVREIASPGDLAALRADLRKLGPAPRIRLSFDSGALADRRRREDRMNALLADCGCTVGSLVMASSLVSYVLALAVGLPITAWSDRAFFGFAVAVAGAFAGKVIGLVMARWRVLQALAELEFALSSPAGVQR